MLVQAPQDRFGEYRRMFYLKPLDLIKPTSSMIPLITLSHKIIRMVYHFYSILQSENHKFTMDNASNLIYFYSIPNRINFV